MNFFVHFMAFFREKCASYMFIYFSLSLSPSIP